MANLALLATDDNNPEFVGARNPDSLLHVRFYERALPNSFQTEKQGRPIFDNIVFIEIHTPGNQLNIIDRPKIVQDELRFLTQWQHYVATHSDDPAKQGTPLSQWPLLDVAKVEMLRAMKFFTVEQIAYSSDEQINHLGMLAGMSPLSFRDRAKAYLEVARDANVVSVKDAELKAAQAKIEAQEAEMTKMKEQMAQILARMAPTPDNVGSVTEAVTHVPLKRGRRRSVVEPTQTE